MTRDTWFKCDPQDFLDGYESLESAEQCAVYSAVVYRIYASFGPIVNNPAAIGAVVHLSRVKCERIIARLIEIGKLQLVDGRLGNNRASDELERRKNLSDTRAKAGKTGGRPTRNESTSDKKTSKPSQFHGETANELPLPVPENRQSTKANAFPTRARETIEVEESSPTPPNRPPGFDGLKPDFDKPLDPEARAATIAKLDIVERVGDRPDGVDVAKLTGDIMREAKMVIPPVDLVLVDSWVRMGIEPETILATATRMAACARGPVRGMRYFDAEMKRVHEASKAASNANIAYFQKIARRHGAKV